MIAGVVLAAGASGRMGEPKAMLRIGEQTFLQHILQTLRSARVMENVIVLGAHTEQISPTLGWFDGKVAVNARWEQ